MCGDVQEACKPLNGGASSRRDYAFATPNLTPFISIFQVRGVNSPVHSALVLGCSFPDVSPHVTHLVRGMPILDQVKNTLLNNFNVKSISDLPKDELGKTLKQLQVVVDESLEPVAPLLQQALDSNDTNKFWET